MSLPECSFKIKLRIFVILEVRIRLKAYLTLFEQLGIYLKELRILESANTVDEAWLMLNKLLTIQEREGKEIEEQMVEEA